MYFGCFIMQNKKTYLYLINFTITNELYENTSISLKANVNHCTATVNKYIRGWSQTVFTRDFNLFQFTIFFNKFNYIKQKQEAKKDIIIPDLKKKKKNKTNFRPSHQVNMGLRSQKSGLR